MIIDKLSNSNLYEFKNPRIRKAIDYLMVNDFSEIKNGKYEIEGNKLYAIVNTYDTKDEKEAYLENHRKYIDIQYVESGTELIGYLPFDGQKVYKEYDEENDYELYDESCSYVKIEKGMFAVFFPGNLHKPGIKSGNISNVKKIVVKVSV